MIRINLLPYREKEQKESLQRQIVIFAGVLVLFALVVVSVQVYFTVSIGSFEKQIEAANTKLVELNKKVGDIEGFKKDKAELEQKLGVINSLEQNRFAPLKMMDELNGLVPAKDVWLEKFTETGSDLQIEGVARDNGAVARFMKNLEKASFVKSVELVFSQEKEVAGSKLQQFTLKCSAKKG